MCFLILLKFPIAIINIFYDNNKARYKRICGVAVNMSPCHGEDRGFDSRQIRQRFFKEKASTTIEALNNIMAR